MRAVRTQELPLDTVLASLLFIPLCYVWAACTAADLLGVHIWAYGAAGLLLPAWMLRTGTGWWRWPVASAIVALFFGITFVGNESWLPAMLPILVVLLYLVPEAALQTPLSELWHCTSATSCEWPSVENEIVLVGPFLAQWIVLLALGCGIRRIRNRP
jgi:hypothetical protein